MRRSAVAARDGGAGGRRGSRYAAWCLVSVVVALSVAAVPAVAGDDWTWEQYEGCQDPKGTEAFVKRFPDSARAAQGRACLERWKEEEDEWRKVADCGDVGRVEAFLERYPEGRYAEQARACPGVAVDPALVVLPDGFTLADWALLAEERLREGDFARLLAEANAHLRSYGRVGLVTEVRERAVEGLVAGTRVETVEEARAGLKRIARVEAAAGARPELSRLKGRAHRLLGDWEAAAEAYVEWLRLAPQSHPQRVEVLRVLQRVRAVAAEQARFAERLGRGFSAEAVDEATGWTDLHYAAVLNLPEVAKALLDAGVAVDVRLRDGSQPFGERLIANLGKMGHDFSGWKADGETALMLAARSDARDTAALLLDRGADIEAKNNNGETPLHYAAWNNARDTAALLLDRGADIEAKNNDGNNPLHYAALKNARDTAALLLDRGADIEAKNNDGETPLHRAVQEGAHQTAELLRARGAIQMMDRGAFKEFCDKREKQGSMCFSNRTRDDCDGCDLAAVRRLRSELDVLVDDSGSGFGTWHEPGCVGYRDDLGGTLEMAELVRSVLGAGYYIGDCTSDGFPINVHVIE